MPVFAIMLAAVVSFMPMLSTESIIPGIDTRAPERTESSNGLMEPPNSLLISLPTFAMAASTSSTSPSGNVESCSM